MLELNFTVPLRNVQVHVFDLSGRLLISGGSDDAVTQLQVPASILSDGLYLVNIESPELRVARLLQGLR
jgi:hypothetical protein